ncbi:unnamed protein product, partial [marine sediment metagenome]
MPPQVNPLTAPLSATRRRAAMAGGAGGVSA